LFLSNSSVYAIFYQVYRGSLYKYQFRKSDLTAKRECSFRLPKCSGLGWCKSKTSHFLSRKDEDKFAPRKIKSGRDTLSVCLGDETTHYAYLYRVPIYVRACTIIIITTDATRSVCLRQRVLAHTHRYCCFFTTA